jgi:hypothetical protein
MNGLNLKNWNLKYWKIRLAQARPGSDNATGRRAVTRARGRQTGIIHTALLFSYLDNPDN